MVKNFLEVRVWTGAVADAETGVVFGFSASTAEDSLDVVDDWLTVDAKLQPTPNRASNTSAKNLFITSEWLTGVISINTTLAVF